MYMYIYEGKTYDVHVLYHQFFSNENMWQTDERKLPKCNESNGISSLISSLSPWAGLFKAWLS